MSPTQQPTSEVKMSSSRVQLPAEQQAPKAADAKIRATDLNFYYGSFQALHGISMEIFENKVTAFIGPSGCGKSTFVRTLNRMHETVRGARVEGKILLDGENIFDQEVSN